MITVNRVNDVITGVYGNAKSFTVPYTEELFKKLMEYADAAEAVTSVADMKNLLEEFEKLIQLDYNTYIATKVDNVYKHTDGRYYMRTGNVTSSVPMPPALVERLENTIDQGLDATPLIKFWTRFLRNPKLRKLRKDQQYAFSQRVFNYVNMPYTNYELAAKLMDEKGYTPEVADKMATVPQVQISKEGLLKTFKVSREITKKWVLDENGQKKQVDMIPTTADIDPITGLVTYTKTEHTNEDRWFEPAVQGQGGDAFFCTATGKAGHVIKVGATHSITWEQINTNDHTSCVPGLHIGGLSYIKGYQTDNTETHNILVDPAHIGA